MRTGTLAALTLALTLTLTLALALALTLTMRTGTLAAATICALYSRLPSDDHSRAVVANSSARRSACAQELGSVAQVMGWQQGQRRRPRAATGRAPSASQTATAGADRQGGGGK